MRHQRGTIIPEIVPVVFGLRKNVVDFCLYFKNLPVAKLNKIMDYILCGEDFKAF